MTAALILLHIQGIPWHEVEASGSLNDTHEIRSFQKCFSLLFMIFYFITWQLFGATFNLRVQFLTAVYKKKKTLSR